MKSIITHKSSDAEWIDESGTRIPYNRTTKAERVMERNSARILKSALDVNKRLANFKELVRDLSNEAFEAFMEEKSSNRVTKGNFTWYNFNRSIKIEVAVNEPIVFDDLTIKAAKEKFDQFLESEISSKNEFAKQMIIESFETQRNGQLDVKQVMKTVRWEKKVNDPLFSEGCDLVNQAIRRPKSKTYFRVWVRDEAGEYQNIELNLSSI